ncbi:response regulator transcription factor [Ornithinicoccus hortensis]|uniref:LuxR family two component transcriptional regulator n=1 Tax=Ornithinicoccus hortensis TaxID=82346 RepID=A0A542YMK1_9MICO|nr:response regulator transcription factor [Ornithinicoccus hortensis]TQL49317.1 LuxR family two component transcriptional regulator [Ornithinicoccus hortensis]
MIRVVIAEDEPLLRSGLTALAEHDGDIEVVAGADQGGAALARVRETRPDVVLMDIRMPGLDGIAATQLITEDPDLADVSVLVLTTFAEDQTVVEALRAGAAGYLLKDVAPEDLREAVRAVAAGRPVLSPEVTATVMRAAASARSGADHDLIAHLAPREVEVLTGVGEGLNNAEIAARLFISPATARTYVSRLLRKLDARDRAQLVVIAHRSGLVDRHG